MSKIVYVIGDSHAVALHGKNNFAVTGANMHQIESQAQKNVPDGATVVFSGGHNDISNGKSPTQVATAVAALISKLKSRGCKVSYVLFPEGTKNNNQNQMAKARSEIKSKVNDIIVYDLNDEPNKLDKDGQHMQYSAYVSIQKQINSQNSETSSPVITTPRPRATTPRPRATTPSTRPRQNVFPFEPVKTDEWLQRRRSFLMNLHSGIGMNLSVHGNTAIGAGDIVEVNLKSPLKNPEINKDDFYSGNFLVTKIKHVFRVSNAKHEMSLTVMKDSIERKLPTGANDEPASGVQHNPEQSGERQRTTPVDTPGEIRNNRSRPGYPADLKQSEIEDMIREEANLRGMDANAAIRVFRSEGAGSYQSGVKRAPSKGGSDGGYEASYGPYQLFTGGGLGNEYEKTTGRSLRNDNTREGVRNQVRFSLNAAVRAGNWSAWYGADKGLEGGRKTKVSGRQVNNVKS
jgi:hypothetical protein